MPYIGNNPIQVAALGQSNASLMSVYIPKLPQLSPVLVKVQCEVNKDFTATYSLQSKQEYGQSPTLYSHFHLHNLTIQKLYRLAKESVKEEGEKGQSFMDIADVNCPNNEKL
jgi:hypothetical protein